MVATFHNYLIDFLEDLVSLYTQFNFSLLILIYKFRYTLSYCHFSVQLARRVDRLLSKLIYLVDEIIKTCLPSFGRNIFGNVTLGYSQQN